VVDANGGGYTYEIDLDTPTAYGISLYKGENIYGTPPLLGEAGWGTYIYE
jgi:hypothetical protein